MSKLKFHIVEVSSESPSHPVINITKDDQSKTWETDGPNEEAHLVLEFDKEVCIDSLEFGNNGAAFFDVSIIDKNGQAEELMPRHALLASGEWKDPKAMTKRKVLNSDPLFHITKRAHSCIKLKISLSQPYVTIPIGLSALRIFGRPATPQLLAAKSEAALKAAARSQPSQTQIIADEEKSLPFAKQKSVAPAPAKPSSVKKHARDTDVDEHETPVPPPKRAMTTASATSPKPPGKSLSLEEGKRSTSAGLTDSGRKATSWSSSSDDKPFSQLMKGVVLAISGIANPDRANLRKMATEMGAQYRPDWTSDATHLIAVFPDTDKVRAAHKAHAVVVSRQWLVDSHTKRKLLPVENYSLDQKKPSPVKKAMADDDDEEEEEAEFSHEESDNEENSGKKQAKAKPKTPIKSFSPSPGVKPKPPIASSFRDDDDEDEPLVIRKTPKNDEKGKGSDNLPSGSTSPSKRPRIEENGDDSNRTEELPATDMERKARSFLARTDTVVLDLLSGCKIFLHGNLDRAMKKLLVRYITLYDGDLVDKVDAKTTHIVSQMSADDVFLTEIHKKYPAMHIVRPSWVVSTHSKKKREREDLHRVKCISE